MHAHTNPHHARLLDSLNSGLIHKILSRNGVHPTDLEDAVQDFSVYLLEGNRLANFDASRGSFNTYLTRLAKNHCIDLYRKRTRIRRGSGRAQVSLDELESIILEDGSPDALTDQIIGNLLIEKLQQIPPEDLTPVPTTLGPMCWSLCSVWRLRKAGFTLPEIGNLFAVSPQTVINRLKKVYTHLQQLTGM